MPHLKITTNVSKSSVPSNFLKETAGLLSKMLGKPESVSICDRIKVTEQMIVIFMFAVLCRNSRTRPDDAVGWRRRTMCYCTPYEHWKIGGKREQKLFKDHW